MASLAERSDNIEAYRHIAASEFEARAAQAEYDAHGSHRGLGPNET